MNQEMIKTMIYHLIEKKFEIKKYVIIVNLDKESLGEILKKLERKTIIIFGMKMKQHYVYICIGLENESVLVEFLENSFIKYFENIYEYFDKNELID